MSGDARSRRLGRQIDRRRSEKETQPGRHRPRVTAAASRGRKTGRGQAHHVGILPRPHRGRRSC